MGEEGNLESKLDNPSGKRLDYISWDDKYMGVALIAAQRSKDPNTQVGACIVQKDIIVGTGYNGFPRGIKDEELSWLKEGEWLDTKKPYVVHAEANAITNSAVNLKGAKIYVTLSPCNECAKLIAQSQISEVIYQSNKYKDKPAFIAAQKILDLAGIKTRKYEPTRDSITLYLKE